VAIFCEAVGSNEGGFKKADIGSPASPRVKHALPRAAHSPWHGTRPSLARPQPLGRAERTEKYVSAHDAKRQFCAPEGGKERERRWRLFSTLPACLSGEFLYDRFLKIRFLIGISWCGIRRRRLSTHLPSHSKKALRQQRHIEAREFEDRPFTPEQALTPAAFLRRMHR
jgi:hypothetical protein